MAVKCKVRYNTALIRCVTALETRLICLLMAAAHLRRAALALDAQ